MIRPPQARITVDSQTVLAACNLVDRSNAHSLIEGWASDDSARNGQTLGRPAYPARAILVGLFLLIQTRQPLSWASLLQLFWLQLTRPDLEAIGLKDTVAIERQQRFRTLAGSAEPPATILKEYQSEYTRLTRSLDNMFEPLRFSPHHRRGRQRNRDLHLVAASRTESERARTDTARQRYDSLLNVLVAASVDRALIAPHRGDVMYDEVVIQVAKAHGNTGTKPALHHSGNPDAAWFTKGRDFDTPRWAHGATFVMISQRPDEPRVPVVVVGMSLDKPTGGAVADTIIALDHAERNGLLKAQSRQGKRSRLAIADMGFTMKNGLNRAMIDRGYYLLQDFPRTRKPEMRRPLAEGALLFNGIVLCPGFAGAASQPFERLPEDASGSTKLRHQQREAQLLAGRMHPNGKPKPATKAGRGRPRKGAEPSEDMRIEVFCPADSGQCKCPLRAQSMALGPDKPSVPSPPSPAHLPRVCANTSTPVLLSPSNLKQYGLHLYGSREHERLYSYARTHNEQWHSQLRANHTGGIDGSVFRTLGVERIGVIVALAVAETNLASQDAFRRRNVRGNLSTAA